MSDLGQSGDALPRQWALQRALSLRVWALLICGTLWINVLVGNWVWVFAYHSHRGMVAFYEWQTNPSAESRSTWLREKARMDETATRVRWVQVAFLTIPPIIVLVVFRRTRLHDGVGENPGRITMR